MEKKKKATKVTSFQDNNIWLNVLVSTGGTELFTIARGRKTAYGWKSSPFFVLKSGDIESI